jgi:hypothetical protein
MSKALITPPLPEELWYRIREIQTRKGDCILSIEFIQGKVKEWKLSLLEYPHSGRQDIRLQALKEKDQAG